MGPPSSPLYFNIEGCDVDYGVAHFGLSSFGDRRCPSFWMDMYGNHCDSSSDERRFGALLRLVSSETSADPGVLRGTNWPAN